MSLDHSKNNRRTRHRELQRDSQSQTCRAEWRAISAAEQAKYAKIAERYAEVNPFCRSIVDSGRPISKRQAHTLGNIDAEKRGLIDGDSMDTAAHVAIPDLDTKVEQRRKRATAYAARRTDNAVCRGITEQVRNGAKVSDDQVDAIVRIEQGEAMAAARSGPNGRKRRG